MSISSPTYQFCLSQIVILKCYLITHSYIHLKTICISKSTVETQSAIDSNISAVLPGEILLGLHDMLFIHNTDHFVTICQITQISLIRNFIIKFFFDSISRKSRFSCSVSKLSTSIIIQSCICISCGPFKSFTGSQKSYFKQTKFFGTFLVIIVNIAFSSPESSISLCNDLSLSL